jgi:hypothetical protein
MPVSKISLSSFDMFVLLIVLLSVGVYIYFHFKNKRKQVRHVDQKAGDEGEDL